MVDTNKRDEFRMVLELRSGEPHDISTNIFLQYRHNFKSPLVEVKPDGIVGLLLHLGRLTLLLLLLNGRFPSLGPLVECL